MMEIAKIILVGIMKFNIEFFQYMEKFVSAKQPNEDLLKDVRVKDEKNSFCHNVRLMNEIILFFKSCYEVYKILVKQVEDMVIVGTNFFRLQQFIARARFNVSYLISSMKNHINSYINDMNVPLN